MKKANFQWPVRFHAYLKGRRREGAMLMQRAFGVRLSAEKYSYYNDLRDMKNAVACAYDEFRMRAMKAIVAASHSAIFEQRVLNAVVDLKARDGSLVQVIPQVANVIGSSEGPILFLAAYSVSCDQWVEESRSEEKLGPNITLSSPVDGSEIDGAFCGFADDTFVKRIVEDG
eukprot:4624308-Heterocapsa_arctica.AAC.1